MIKNENVLVNRSMEAISKNAIQHFELTYRKENSQYNYYLVIRTQGGERIIQAKSKEDGIEIFDRMCLHMNSEDQIVKISDIVKYGIDDFATLREY